MPVGDPSPADLGAALACWAGGDRRRRDVTEALEALAVGAMRLAVILGRGPLGGDLTAGSGVRNADGDAQKVIDVLANDIFIEALRRAPVAFLASEESPTPLSINERGSLAVAIDPLDGSASVGANLSVGAIFSILPAGASAEASFLRPCADQIAAGYFLFGSSTILVLTLGDGVDLYVLDVPEQSFKRAATRLRTPGSVAEIAINMSNWRHWPAPIKTFVDDCLAGADGERRVNTYTRWLAVMVAEAHRILLRGGLYIYPSDSRPGFEHGRLRLIYEAAPIAMLMEQAGAAAIDGGARILDRTPMSLHERTPLIFGSSEDVETVRRYHLDPSAMPKSAPLFQQRGLFTS